MSAASHRSSAVQARQAAAFVIDAAAAVIVEANPAGWQLLDRDPGSAAGPVSIDRAMPLLQSLRELPRDAETSCTRTMTVWSARRAVRLVCGVEPCGTGPGDATFLVRVLGEADSDADAAKSEPGAMAHLAHELRTPLGAVLAYAEILKDEHFGPLENARYRGYARDIWESARHALGVVDSLLGGESRRVGIPQLAFSDLDPGRIAESCLTVARPLAERAGLTLTADLQPRLPRIVADELTLKQMLLNLLANAIKFSRSGDKVTLAITYETGSELRIAVADTGPGMCADARQRRATANAGLGIGLPLTRALAEANGAALAIDSAPGRGTCVTISFGKDRIVPV